MSDIIDLFILNEVSEHNDHLREQNRLTEELLDAQEEANAQRRMQQEKKLSKEISTLFEQFHRQNYNEHAFPAAQIADLGQQLFERYKQFQSQRSKPYVYKPTPTLKPIVIPLIIMGAMLPLYALDTPWHRWIPMAVVFIFLLAGISGYRQDKKKRASQERIERELIERHTRNMQELKKQFSNLTAYGVWLKYYIDTAVEPTIKVLKRQGSLRTHDDALKRFYLLFGMHADPTLEYDRARITGMGRWHAEIFEAAGS